MHSPGGPHKRRLSISDCWHPGKAPAPRKQGVLEPSLEAWAGDARQPRGKGPPAEGTACVDTQKDES